MIADHRELAPPRLNIIPGTSLKNSELALQRYSPLRLMRHAVETNSEEHVHTLIVGKFRDRKSPRVGRFLEEALESTQDYPIIHLDAKICV